VRRSQPVATSARIGETKAHVTKQMGKPYISELRQLSKTIDWAWTTDLKDVRGAVSTAESLPLLAVGSGGSLTAAHLLAAAHRRYTGHQSSVLTPLDASTHRIDPDLSVWLLSAGGSNVDILAAFFALVRAESQQLAVLCGRRGSPLSEAAAKHGFVDLIDAQGPAGKDGFLATNSLVAASILILPRLLRAA
jgi:fructoselysine-6-P-deglycase FrlB-like protein